MYDEKKNAKHMQEWLNLDRYGWMDEETQKLFQSQNEEESRRSGEVSREQQ